jgi:hypothetical protein
MNFFRMESLISPRNRLPTKISFLVDVGVGTGGVYRTGR